MFNSLPETEDSTCVLLFSRSEEVFFLGGGTRPFGCFTDDRCRCFSRTTAFFRSNARFSCLSGTQLSIEHQGGCLPFLFRTPAISFFPGILFLFLCDMLTIRRVSDPAFVKRPTLNKWVTSNSTWHHLNTNQDRRYFIIFQSPIRRDPASNPASWI